MSKPIGGGMRETITVPWKKGTVAVEARMGLFRLPLGVVVEPADHAGKILVPHWEELAALLPPGENRRRFRWRSKHLHWHMVASVYHAYRQTWHILAQYGVDLRTGEKASLQQAAIAARQLNLAVLGLAPGMDIAGMRAATKETIATVAASLGQPRKLSKAEAAGQLAALSKGSDRSGRVNVSASMARSLKVYDLLLERLQEEVMVIDPHIEARQKTLVNMIQLAELRLQRVDDLLALMLRRDGLKPLFDHTQRKVVTAQLRYDAQDLETIDFLPYRRTCQETARDLRDAAAAIERGPLDRRGMLAIRTLLEKSRNAITIKRCQIEIERLIFQVMRVEQQSAKRIATEAIHATIVSVKRALSRVEERGFRHPVCAEALRHLEAAQSSVLIWADLQITRQQSALLLKELRQALKAASAVL